jgi:hypothetical protein
VHAEITDFGIELNIYIHIYVPIYIRVESSRLESGSGSTAAAEPKLGKYQTSRTKRNQTKKTIIQYHERIILSGAKSSCCGGG